MKTIYSTLENTIKRLEGHSISDDRKAVLAPVISYLAQKLTASAQPNLNFICTHNSRRSQFAQVWAYMAAKWYGVQSNAYSGGVEVTAFNSNAIKSLRKAGFDIFVNEGTNPTCYVKCNETSTPLPAFSKLFNHETNPKENFAAVMTCSDADENCPFIPGAEERIALLYDDPKEFDNTAKQEAKYLERSEQIGRELLYVFREVKGLT